MARETRDRPATSTASRPLASLLAHSTTSNDLLPHLHQHALDVTGGSCSLFFQHNTPTGQPEGSLRVGLDGLNAEPWLPGTDEAALVADAFTRRLPTLVSDVTRQT